ncbi:MAG: excinuclease ABC subunit B [Omnitrophica bacterium RIFCSPLOWO2_01_FULL_50_24]|nr:MAG: excinuclease ABC subunit B [Omnitrophica bacterium RIFCSPLOWO2_01_FULL_50_24]
MPVFDLDTSLKPQGDQPKAIRALVASIQSGRKEQVLVGVTGSGKTFTMANVIAQCERPALVISHNKTLAAQLYSELKDFFPSHAVEYFVSYYDYYQPEAYIPQRDIYIEKDASINDDLDRLRLAATGSVLSRRDVIVVSSVSCIYGIGAPEDWEQMLIRLKRGERLVRDELLSRLVDIQYQRLDRELKRGTFRVRGNVVDVLPSYGTRPYRILFSGDRVEQIALLDTTHRVQKSQPLEELALYPAKHFVTSRDRIERAMKTIRAELTERVKELIREGKELEAKRLESRTRYDLEMLAEVGYSAGIENYSRHISGRSAGSRPYTLLDYFPKDALIFIDESHQTIPQIRGMYQGDQSRKNVLVNHGFRLPSALDNRPLNFAEFERIVGQVVYVSATPGPYEMQRSTCVVEQIIRPTGLTDPEIFVRPTDGEVDDLIREIKARAQKKERTLVTTLTKRMAEDLSRYLQEAGVRAQYLHSELDAFERVDVLRDLRLQKYDCVVGINLLREGLDLPEVSLVVILDADKEGFLRSDVSLIQISGRAARHINGAVIMYADRLTDSMSKAIQETSRRRSLQERFNQEHGIRPASIQKEIRAGIERWREAKEMTETVVGESAKEHELKSYLAYLYERMMRASSSLDFEQAVRFRDEIRSLERTHGLERKSKLKVSKK